MTTIGFSAFLKLISLNPKPQHTLIRKRILPDGSSARDFHRSLRLRAHRLLVDGLTLDEVLATLGRIKRDSERQSARSGLEKLTEWRRLNPGALLTFPSMLFESPQKKFKVRYLPDFGIMMDGRSVAVHIWNTGKPQLDVRMTYAALSLFTEVNDNSPDDIAVLSLRNSVLYRRNEVPDHSEIALNVIDRLDDIFDEIQHPPERPSIQDQPPASPG